MSAHNTRITGHLRGAATVLGLLLVGVVLRVAGSTRAQISAAAADPQGYVTVAGPDQFVLALATAAGWLLLGWVILGAVLVLGSAAPGWLGWLFARLARLLVPATLRRFVSLALGISLLTGTSMASAAPPATMAAISVTLDWPSNPPASLGVVPDWPPAPTPMPDTTPAPAPVPFPTSEPGASPAEPTSPPPPLPSSEGPGGQQSTATYVVASGDCLWDVAERALAQTGRPIDSASVASEVAAWWQANSAQILDPDLIYPGQVLTAPAP